MKKNLFTKKVQEELKEKMEDVKETVKDIKMPDISMPDKQSFTKLKERIVKSKEKRQEEIKIIPVSHALEIVYFLMKMDGEISDKELDEFRNIAKEFNAEFLNVEKDFLEICNQKEMDGSNYKEVLEKEFEEILSLPLKEEWTYINTKHLIWILFTIAYTDGEYNEKEQEFIQYVSNCLKIDETILLEFHNSILTLNSLKKEMEWIKRTDRPYLEIEKNVEEISKRESIILNNVVELITY